MTVAQALLYPTARIVILAEVTAGLWCRAWVVDGTFTLTYKISTTLEISSVRWNRSTLLTQRASAALVDANAGSWYWDGTVLWVRPLSGSIFDATVQAMASFYWANQPKILSNRWYDPRLISAPALQQRIEATFAGRTQVGGGTLSLINNDGFFNSFQDLQWDAGTAVIKIGVDVPVDQDMAFGDYQTMATWRPSQWTVDETTFTLKLIEPTARIHSKLPLTFYDRTIYPTIDDQAVGKPIPIAYGRLYGVKPTVIDQSLRKFKVASHAIREFSEVRVRQDNEFLITTTVAATSWGLYSGTTYRYYVPDQKIKNVTFNAVSLTEKNSIEDCVATTGSWASSDNFVYVNPSGGQTISSGTYVVNSSKTFTSFRTIQFASVDTANAEFTLDTSWSTGQDVSVDILGKLDGTGVLMTNSFAIIEDILALVGETNLNSASFTTAKARLQIGLDESAAAVTVRNVGVYLNETREAIETINDILAIIGGFIYSDSLGQYYVGLFQPTAGEALQLIRDADIMTYEQVNDAEQIISKVSTTFAERKQDAWTQLVAKETVGIQYIRDQPQPAVKDQLVEFPTESDASNWAQRVLVVEGNPLKTFRITMAWLGLLLKPGDQFLFQFSARSINRVVEVLATRIDLGTKMIEVTAGNLRAQNDSAGWWVADAAVLPTRFAALVGYGAGSNVWNKNWHADIKAWARQNVGYWTDANGFADTTDADSFIPSSWI
jgi:hypothetical protein